MSAENSERERTSPAVLALSAAVTESPANRRVGLLAREHAPALGRFLRYLGVAPSDVEDALQDVFIVAHRRLIETPDATEAPGPWLRGVAVNVARNRARSSHRSRVEFVEEAPEMIDARTPEAEVAAERDRRRLLRLLSALNEEHRAALVLFEIEGRPMKEVATTLGIALPTAYKYVTSAQTKLREAFLQESETR